MFYGGENGTYVGGDRHVEHNERITLVIASLRFQQTRANFCGGQLMADQGQSKAGLHKEWTELAKSEEKWRSEVIAINDRLKREMESRKQSEERYRLLVETTNDLIWELDQNGVYTYVSPRAKDLLGYEPDELIGRTPFEFMPPGESERINALFHEHVASGQGILPMELTRLHKDGRPLVHETNVSPVFDAAGRCCGFRGISRDITGRKRVEESLRQNHEELQAIYDGMVDGLLIADVETRNFVRANQAICTMLGYSEEEVLALSVMNVHPLEALPDILRHFKEQADGRLAAAEDLPILRKDGSVFYADITTNRLVYQGRPCVIGFFRDITERKEANESLRNEHEVLRQLLKAQDRERQVIAYEIHDGLAQHLTAAIMLFQTIDPRNPQAPEKASEVCGDVQRLLSQSLAEARRLISGVRPPILDEYGVVPAIEYLASESVGETDMEVSVRSEVAFDRLAPAIENTIYRIVQESLSNARRHSKSDRVEIEIVQNHDRVRIVVQDWGIGFDPQNVDDKCFGLTGIRERTRLLGGDVHIDTSPGKGSRIVVELPITTGEADG